MPSKHPALDPERGKRVYEAVGASARVFTGRRARAVARCARNVADWGSGHTAIS